MSVAGEAGLSPDAIATRVRELGDWFHNLDLAGVKTAPHHFLGDYPTCKWQRFAHALPPSLQGKTVLDVGCNAGFYALQMKERGAARVVAIDEDEGYLAQARFAAQVHGADIEFHQMSVYDVAQLGERFDLVIFMGVLYHLRHPLLALDLLSEHVVGDLFLFQSMLRGSAALEPIATDYPFQEVAHFDSSAYPKLHFVEHRYAKDPTNWWIPNKSCVEAMLRSAGFSISCNPEQEVYLCRVDASARSRRGPDSIRAADLRGLRA
jgi:tRNA (mo5U34)-methyltransferase